MNPRALNSFANIDEHIQGKENPNLQEKDQQIGHLQALVKDLNGRSSSLKGDNEVLQLENASLKTEADNMEEEIRDLRIERDALKKQLIESRVDTSSSPEE